MINNLIKGIIFGVMFSFVLQNIIKPIFVYKDDLEMNFYNDKNQWWFPKSFWKNKTY